MGPLALALGGMAASYAAGFTVGVIVSYPKRAMDRVRAARAEVRRIHAVAEPVAEGAYAADVIAIAQEQLRQLLGLESCWFEAEAHGVDLPRLERTGTIQATVHRYTGPGFELPAGGVELPVLTRGRPAGRFVLVPTPGRGTSLEQRVVAVAIADQVGAALAPFPPQRR